MAQADADLVDDATSEWCAGQPSEPAAAVPAAEDPADAKRAGDGLGGGTTGTLCAICGVNPRATKQTFCSAPCAADVKAS